MCLCKGCDGCCVFCLNYEAWSCWCIVMHVYYYHTFTLYTEMLMRNIDGRDRFKIGGRVVNNLCYDIVIVSELKEELQEWMNGAISESESRGYVLKIKS